MSQEFELTQQQKLSFDRFKELKVGALFMQMGTGKTRVAIELVNYNQPDFLLYLTPFSTINNIKAELEKWGVNCPYRVVGYETIASSDKTYLEVLAELDNYENKFIIADESIFIKNGMAKRTRRSYELRKKCQYALILNGTPIVKDEWDLYNQMNFLSPKIIPHNSYEFIRNFFVEHLIRKNGREMRYYTFYEPNRPVLTKLVAPYVFYAELEFDKEEKENIDWIEVDDTEYKKAKNEVLESAVDTDCLIQLFSTLNRVAACSEEKNKEVANYIKDKQIICFCNYLEEVEQIKGYCDCYVITGDTPVEERKLIVEQFQKDSKPLLMTVGVGSYSLNLQFCNEIVYSSLTFNYGTFEQSKYRIKRTGQERDIKYTYILSELNINDFIFRNLDLKKSLSDVIKTLISEEDIRDFIEKEL